MAIKFEILTKIAAMEWLKRLDDKGQGVAVISTLDVVDRDGDVVRAGAFGKDQVVPIVPAHNWQHVPIGKARIVEEGAEAVAHLSLNLKVGLARAWYEHLKFDVENPPSRQQWSYGFEILKAGDGQHEGRRVRFLESLRVHEVSPVLVGAGVNTRTLALKGMIPLDVVERVCPPCAKEMRFKNLRAISLAELAKQGFTCPKPFATHDECVQQFSGEADIDDPEAFCAAWADFCGERGADPGAGKLAEMTARAVRDYWAAREREARRAGMR